MATEQTAGSDGQDVLERGTYEILRQRLEGQGAELRRRLEGLNAARQEVFGSIPTTLLATERLTTRNNCVPRDMFPIGNRRFLFGYNVQFGLRTEIQLEDVFGLYELRDRQFHELPLDTLRVGEFEGQFRDLYKYYKESVFKRFSRVGPHLFMVFRVGKSLSDIKTFKWVCADGRLEYLGNRSDHEYRYPPQHEFEWRRTHRELHRAGLHPHIAIEDTLFVECVGGDLTIKVEDNTASGEGIYSEPVENADQTLDDAEFHYARVGSLLLLKVRPYQERAWRHFVFNRRMQEVRRIDALGDACVLLPDDQGIVFPGGYYLQSGESKGFETGLSDMHFDRRIAAPNGEDHLYVFHQRESGRYLLMSYNAIAQRIESPTVCQGFSTFENGEMAILRADPAPQKHHVVQIWQTPYAASDWQPPVRGDSFLQRIGNPELVRALAEGQELLTLIGRRDTYADLYLDLVKRSGDMADAYFWLGREDTFDLRSVVGEIRETASAALAEFEKVVRIRRATAAEVARLERESGALFERLATTAAARIEYFVEGLAGLRGLRGDLIAARELRYADTGQLAALEERVTTRAEELARETVGFLLGEEALRPYAERIEALSGAVEQLGRVREAKETEAEVQGIAGGLETLLEVMGQLKIDDATQATAIVDRISGLYAGLNRVRAALRQRMRALRGAEEAAEFSAQKRLLQQAMAQSLDLSDTPERCDEHLNRLLVQVEELEARFADSDEFVLELTEQRTALSNAFETRKIELVEGRNRRAAALQEAAGRILRAVEHRVRQFATVSEIHGYFASDPMTHRVRELVEQLLGLRDTAKAEEIDGRLKALREEAVRQLRDRQELFAGGAEAMQLGRHRFLVNTQELDLTLVRRGEGMFAHLTGTGYFAAVDDPEIQALRDVWDQELVSETPQVYRAEYLAWGLFRELESGGRLDEALGWNEAQRIEAVQQFMAPRHDEGYVKGVHDPDAARYLEALVEVHSQAGLLRYSPASRALAAVWWEGERDSEAGRRWAARARSMAGLRRAFAADRDAEEGYAGELAGGMARFCEDTGLFPVTLAREAAGYLFRQLQEEGPFVVSGEADALFRSFGQHLQLHGYRSGLDRARQELAEDLGARYRAFRDWVAAHARESAPGSGGHVDEVAALLLRDTPVATGVVQVTLRRELGPMAGMHATVPEGRATFDYLDFTRRLTEHTGEAVPRFRRLQARKRAWIEREREALRLESFRPRVMGSFVRNRLIDSVYLPLIGDNLAKQIGVAGDAKRTDRSGLLLVVSPPGYGKTTLIEYLANRLGLVFMKINGPAIGHRVVTLDPAEASGSAAREELEKLNLALEMGDNVMLYLDDIQHLSPEFLQKFISLCDAQRKIEGVFRGRARTYDLRGRKVVVVMAGNPYTESGDRFEIPDMLANRADTYNLGDIVGAHAAAFHDSYLENAATSNPALGRIAARSRRDVLAVLALASGATRDGVDFEADHSPDELNDAIAVARRLFRIRDVVLRVNEEYIRSAAMQDMYRTEPAFRLQGSYRNMNRLAERVAAVMTEAEVEALLQEHYRNESQTLTRDAEANLLKLRELTGALTAAEAERWRAIGETFRRQLRFGSDADGDPVSRVVRQLAGFQDGIEGMRDAVRDGLARLPEALRPADPPPPPPPPPPPFVSVAPNMTFIVAPGSLPLVPAPAGATAPAEVPIPGAEAAPGARVSDGIREVRISQETLRRIWELIESQPTSGPPSGASGDEPGEPGEHTIQVPRGE
ncbi:MAG: DNA repair ATPase [Verrucomicrobiae bacterium]|nr:DNA repair ATPase [Verrucomicrobiae bacterium]